MPKIPKTPISVPSHSKYRNKANCQMVRVVDKEGNGRGKMRYDMIDKTSTAKKWQRQVPAGSLSKIILLRIVGNYSHVWKRPRMSRDIGGG